MELIIIAFLGTLGLIGAELRELIRGRRTNYAIAPTMPAAPRLVSSTVGAPPVVTTEDRYEDAA